MGEHTIPARRDGAGATGGSGDIVINARFLPNGLVDTITHRPEQLSPQEWFDRLCYAVPQTYQPLAGGRGCFRISKDALDAARCESAAD